MKSLKQQIEVLTAKSSDGEAQITALREQLVRVRTETPASRQSSRGYELLCSVIVAGGSFVNIFYVRVRINVSVCMHVFVYICGYMDIWILWKM